MFENASLAFYRFQDKRTFSSSPPHHISLRSILCLEIPGYVLEMVYAVFVCKCCLCIRPQVFSECMCASVRLMYSIYVLISSQRQTCPLSNRDGGNDHALSLLHFTF